MSRFGAHGCPKRTTVRLRWAAGLILLAVFSVGCNPATMLYFLMGAPEPTFPAEVDFTEDNDSPTIAIYVDDPSSITATNELFSVDKMLARSLEKKLREQYEKNGDTVKIIAASKIENLRTQNSASWHAVTPKKLGKMVGADFVVWLDINKLSLYEKGSRRQMYRGKSEIQINVVKVDGKDGDAPVYNNYYHCEFPKLAPEAADIGFTSGHFRARFVTQMAEELTRYFARHPSPTGRRFRTAPL